MAKGSYTWDFARLWAILLNGGDRMSRADDDGGNLLRDLAFALPIGLALWVLIFLVAQALIQW